MVTFGASRDDIKVHKLIVFQDEREDFFSSTDAWRLMTAPFGMVLLGGEVNSDQEIFIQPLKDS